MQTGNGTGFLDQLAELPGLCPKCSGSGATLPWQSASHDSHRKSAWRSLQTGPKSMSSRSHLRRLFKAREWPSPKCISSNADRIVSQTITGAPFSTDTQEESYLDLSWPPSDPEKNNRVLERKLQSKQPRFGEGSRVPIPWQCHTVVTPGPIGLLPMGNHRTDDVTVIASTPSSWHPRKLGHRSENLC